MSNYQQFGRSDLIRLLKIAKNEGRRLGVMLRLAMIVVVCLFVAIIVLIFHSSASAFACNPDTYKGCTPEQLNTISQHQFRQRQAQVNRSYSHSLKAKTAKAEAKRKRLERVYKQRESAIAKARRQEKQFNRKQKRADWKQETLVQNSDGSWTSYKSYSKRRNKLDKKKTKR